MTEHWLAVLADEYRRQVGLQRFMGLPREEIERLHASVEVRALAPNEQNVGSAYLPLATYTAFHYNYTWITFRREQRSLGIGGPVRVNGEVPLFLDETFERAARAEVEKAKLLGAPADWRLAGLIHAEDRLGLVYIARLRQRWSAEHNLGAEPLVCCRNGELLTERPNFDAWSQILIDNLASL